MSETVGQLSEGDRRLAKLSLTREFLAQLLGIRPGLQIIAVRYNAADPDCNGGIDVALEGDGLPVVPFGGHVPIVDPDMVRF